MVRQIGGPMNRCPSCDEPLDMGDEQPLGMFGDFLMGRIVHPEHQQPQRVD
jgi:hypothetical protein